MEDAMKNPDKDMPITEETAEMEELEQMVRDKDAKVKNAKEPRPDNQPKEA
jgi:hypothetical protein